MSRLGLTAVPHDLAASPRPGLVLVISAVGSVCAGFLLPFEALMVLAAVVSLLVIVALGAGPALRAPVLGLGVLMVVGTALPMETEVGSRTIGLSGPLAGVICVVGGLRWLMPSRPLALEPSPSVHAALALMGVATLSFVVGQFPWFTVSPAPMSAQVVGLALFVLSGALFLVTAHEVRTPEQLHRLVWLFVGSGAAVVAVDLVGTAGLRVPGSALIGAETIGSGFWTWLVAICGSQALCNRDLRPGWRVALAVMAVVGLGRGLGLSFSWVSGWLPPLVALGVVVLFRFPRFTLGIGLLAAAPLLLVSGALLSTLAAGESYSLMTRMDAIEVMRPVLERSPWLGLGPANYYQYTVLFPILGWYVNFSSHNNYVDLAAQTGLVGLTVFLWFAVAVGVLAFRLRRRVRTGFEYAYVVGALGGLAGALVSGLLADWLIPFVYNVGLRGFRSSLLFWVFLGGVVAVKRMNDSLAGTEAPS